MDRNATSSPAPESASQRRSGRVVRAPARFSPELLSTHNASKRKRGTDQDGQDAENDVPGSDAEMSDDDDDAETDDEQASRPRRKQASQSSRVKKPALKKPKTNGTHPALSVRPKKTVRIAKVAGDGDGLFGQLSQ